MSHFEADPINNYLDLNIGEHQRFLTNVTPIKKSPISPLVRKTSKGKPENICQLLNNNPSASSRTLSTAGLEFEFDGKSCKEIEELPTRKISLAANMKM